MDLRRFLDKYGNMMRDFTYIDDIVEGLVRVIDNPAKSDVAWNSNEPDTSSSKAPYKIYNIGKGSPIKLLDFIEEIENELGKKAKKNLLPLQMGDVPATFAQTKDLEKDLMYKPQMDVKEGIGNFIKWYKEFYF